jgi:hypothetical protein
MEAQLHLVQSLLMEEEVVVEARQIITVRQEAQVVEAQLVDRVALLIQRQLRVGQVTKIQDKLAVMLVVPVVVVPVVRVQMATVDLEF